MPVRRIGPCALIVEASASIVRQNPICTLALQHVNRDLAEARSAE